MASVPFFGTSSIPRVEYWEIRQEAGSGFGATSMLVMALDRASSIELSRDTYDIMKEEPSWPLMYNGREINE
ncbi:MAG: hypothetical protein JO166_13675 [Deltaproteobacteria bacterium]|nr:hypothetical protein [Deltaproteobacteria bacterium]